MRAAGYAPANSPTLLRQRLAELLGRPWFRGRTRRSRTAAREHRSTRTEVHGASGALSIARIGQLSVFTTDIDWSRAWYEDVTGLHHSRTMEREPHPRDRDRQIRCCYLSARDHDECLVLIEEYDAQGRIVAPSGMCSLHFALAHDGRKAPPVDNGQTGGDVTRGYYDPDWNYVAFCRGGDVGSNRREPGRDVDGHQRPSLDSSKPCRDPGCRRSQSAIEGQGAAAAE
jgi:catechol 2,3-dioxygenase-like lactoylglutathione lyase family enzyme